MNAVAWFVIGLTVGSAVTMMLTALGRQAADADRRDLIEWDPETTWSVTDAGREYVREQPQGETFTVRWNTSSSYDPDANYGGLAPWEAPYDHEAAPDFDPNVRLRERQRRYR